MFVCYLIYLCIWICALIVCQAILLHAVLCLVKSSLLTYSFDLLTYRTNLSGLTAFSISATKKKSFWLTVQFPFTFTLGNKKQWGNEHKEIYFLIAPVKTLSYLLFRQSDDSAKPIKKVTRLFLILQECSFSYFLLTWFWRVVFVSPRLKFNEEKKPNGVK